MKYKKIRRMLMTMGLCLALASGLCACGNAGKAEVQATIPTDKYRTTYEVFVRSFYDSDGDGIGDLKGLTEKLDLLNDGDVTKGEDLGISQIWLMPIAQAASCHKYDVVDYEAVDPEFGSLEDFDQLVAACHDRGINVILDMVINHTSDQHPWFQAARDYLEKLPEGREPDASACPYVDYYNFSREKMDGYEPLGETGWYYEARFWSGMPDLNLDNEKVRAELTDIASFWLNQGVDGFRMDAVTSYYTGNNDANRDFMAWYADMVRGIKEDAYLVGEAWTDQQIYAPYYASGFDSYFDFAFAGQDGIITRTVQGSIEAGQFVTAMQKEEELYASYNEEAINAPFFTNHDMARAAGYFAGDDGSKTKLAGALNLLQTGNAFIYYGEELGMKGSGKDENKRAPMLWSSEEEAEGTCQAPPGMDAVKMKYPGLAEQMEDPLSIRNYYKEAIRIRNTYPEIARGRTVPEPALSDAEIGAFYRTGEDGEKKLLILFNSGEETREIDLGKADLPEGISAEKLQLADSLQVSGEEAKAEKGKLTLPARGVVVFTW